MPQISRSARALNSVDTIAGDDDGELIATEPSQQVVSSYLRRQSLAHRLQQQVTGA